MHPVILIEKQTDNQFEFFSYIRIENQTKTNIVEGVMDKSQVEHFRNTPKEFINTLSWVKKLKMLYNVVKKC